jgi:DNA repair exonuclease SbcCD ATPase subunit
MTGDDRRINKILIQERDERVKAIEDLQKAIKNEGDGRVKALEDLYASLRREEDERGRAMKNMQRTIDDLTRRLDSRIDDVSRDVQRIDSMSRYPPPPVATQTHSSEADILAEQQGQWQATMDKKMATQQGQLDGFARMMQQNVNHLQELFAEYSAVGPKISALEEAQRKQTLQAPPSALPPVVSAAPPPPTPTPSSQSDLGARLAKVDEVQGKHTRQIASIRSLVVETYMSLQMHAIKASRIALRCTTLSDEDRKLTLQNLDAKERLVQEDIKRIYARLDASSPGMAIVPTNGRSASASPNRVAGGASKREGSAGSSPGFQDELDAGNRTVNI